MPPSDSPFGPETLTIPAYLATGPDDPGLAEWKRDHPDSVEAGTWTPAPPSAESQRRLDATRATVGRGRDVPPLDPATISLSDFHAVAAAARTPALHPANHPPRAPTPHSGQPRDNHRPPTHE